MSKMENGDTLKIARKLVNHLPEKTDKELKSLLRRAEQEQDAAAEIEIADLLLTNENIRLWMREQAGLDDEKNRVKFEYGSLPGSHAPVPASWKWTCPQAGCPESWPVIQEGEDAPLCDAHGCRMVRGDRAKG